MLTGLYVKLGVAAIALLGMLGGFFYVNHLKSSITELTAAKIILEQKLKTQNDAIDSLKKESDARAAAAKVEIDLAREETKKAKGKATIIYKTKPSTPDDLCKSALDLINGVSK